jgi:glycosyltransferase involved in cell wall biosynthesis
MTSPVGRRVAYVVSRFPKITETFVLYEMRALEDLGARVEIFPLSREPPGPRHPEAKAFEDRAHVARLLSWRLLSANVKLLVTRPRLYLGTWWHVLRGTWGAPKFFLAALAYFPKCVHFAERMQALDIEHVHAHFATHPALAAHVVNRLTGIPYSFTAHGSDLHVDRTMLATKVEGAAFVVAVSDYNRRLIVAECGESHADKVVVIHCGTDPSVFRVASSSRRGARGADMIVACVASLEEVKGHRFLLDACRMLLDDGVDIRCDLLGEGSLRQDLEQRIHALSLCDRVCLHGAVPREEVRRALASADVAVLASYPTRSGRREGIPVALMEAMMSGLPVVASALSGVPELVEDQRTGFLVPPGDPWSLADRLRILARAPQLRRRMGSRGRSKVLAQFDQARGAQRLLREVDRRARASRSRDT